MFLCFERYCDKPKLKMLEKYYAAYQEKIALPKQMKQTALMYTLKKTRKKSLYFLFCFTIVMCPTIRF